MYIRTSSLADPSRWDIMKPTTFLAQVISLASKVALSSCIKSSTNWLPSASSRCNFFIFLFRGKTITCFCLVLRLALIVRMTPEVGLQIPLGPLIHLLHFHTSWSTLLPLQLILLYSWWFDSCSVIATTLSMVSFFLFSPCSQRHMWPRQFLVLLFEQRNRLAGGRGVVGGSQISTLLR